MTTTKLCSLALLLWTAVARAEAPNRAADETAIRTVLTALGTTWNAHDEARVATLYADDALLVSPMTGRLIEGKAAVVRSFHREHSIPNAIMLGTTWTGAILSQRFIGTDAALVDLDCDIANIKGPGGAVMPGRHVLVVVLQRRAGKWLITDLRPMFTAKAPPALEGKPLGL